MNLLHIRRTVFATMLAMTVAGCTTIPAARGWSQTQSELTTRSPSLAGRLAEPDADNDAISIAVEALLAKPLTLPSAVNVALLKNPRIQIEYQKLELASADWLEASRLSNPVLSASRLDSDEAGSGHLKTLGIAQNFTDLLFLRSRTQVADAALSVARLEAAASIQSLVAETSTAWYAAVSAHHILKLHALITAAADASATLAERFHAAGNISALELARERAAAHQVNIELISAKSEFAGAALELNKLMGLPAPAHWDLYATLPTPPGEVPDLNELIDLGVERRLDVAIQQQHIESLERAVSLAHSLRWLPFVEVGIERERETDGSRLHGPTVAIELPLFGRNKAPSLRAEAALEIARSEQRLLFSNISNAIAGAHAQMSAASAQVDVYRTALVTARETIVKQMQLYQNYMLIGQFELLEAKRDELEAYEGYLHAVRDYWAARVSLSVTTGGELPESKPDHSGHSMPMDSEAATKMAPANNHKGHH